MRDSLTVLAVGLILALTAALVGPYLIDWDARRAFVEARLGETLDARAKIGGRIELRLLPSPTLALEDVTLENFASAPRLRRASARSVRLEIAPAGLLRGEIEIIEAKLERPRVELTLAERDAAAPGEAKSGLRWRFPKISILDGGLVLTDEARGRRFAVDGADLEVSGESLAGPFKGRGFATTAGERFSLRFAAGANEAGEMALKAAVEGAGTTLAFDGAFSWRESAPKLWGTLRAEHGAAHAAAALTLTADRAAFESLELAAGEGARAIAAKGVAALDFSANLKASASLASDRLDLDGWLAAGGASALPPAPWPDIPATLDYTARSLIFKGAAFNDVAVDLVSGRERANAGQPPAWLRLQALGPRGSRIFVDGAVKVREGPSFQGKLQLASQDARWLASWLGPALGQTIPPWARNPPFSAFDLAADAELTPQRVALSELKLAADGLRLSGALTYRPVSATGAARIEAELSSPRTDLAALATLFGGSLAAGAIDGVLHFSAAETHLGDSAPLGALSLIAERSADHIEIEQLTVEGADGAAIAASGRLTPQSVRLDAALDAPRGSQMAAALANLSSASRAALAPRLDALTPAKLELKLEAARKDDGALALKTLTAKGALGAATIRAQLAGEPDRDEELVLTASADWRDGAALLRLIGFEAAGAAGAAGRAHIDLAARGSPHDETQAATLAIALGRMKLDFNGRIGADLAKPAAQGALAVSAPDASLLLRVAGLVFADFRGRPAAALTGDLTLAEGVVRLDGLKGAFDGVNFSGSLAYDRAAHLIGALTAEKLSASSLAALVLGPPEPAKAGALWPSLAFAAPAFNLPDARISLAVGEMDLGAALSPILGAARGLRMELAISPGRLDCDGLAFDLGRARLEGDVKLRRSGGEAWLGARLGVRGAALELAGASGRLDLNVEVSGVGKSADGLVAGLAGSGRARLGDLVLRRADPAALPRIVARFDSDGQHDLSAKTIAAALAAELKKADLQAGERAFDLSIASGVAAFASVPAKPEAPAIAVSLDLRRAMLMQRLSLVDPDPPKGWSGEPARIELSRKGPLAASAASRAPGVEIDAAALSNALANRAIERESARIEAFSFDIRERAFFYRRLASERRRQEERDRAERERTAAEAAQRALGPGEGQPASSRF